MNETWEIWFPQAGAAGLLFARTVVDSQAAGDRVLVHAAPPVIDVVVRDEVGATVATGDSLQRTASDPMTSLRRRGDAIFLEELWPEPKDLGCLVLLCGGEAGVLCSWWHAEDHSEWRWQVEFSNHR
ncbi:MAG: hypothetical protein ACJ73J_10430 [Actinomycetes bacterium]